MLQVKPEKLYIEEFTFDSSSHSSNQTFLLPPMTISRLLEKMTSLNSKIYAHCSCRQLEESISPSPFTWTPQRVAASFIRTNDLGEVEMDDVARDQQMKEITHLNNVERLFVKDKPFKKMGGERAAEWQEREGFITHANPKVQQGLSLKYSAWKGFNFSAQVFNIWFKKIMGP